MARKLVVCCDGTWNKPRNSTNVFRTYRHLATQIGIGLDSEGRPIDQRGADADCRECGGIAADGSEVRLFYQLGVGTMPGQLFSGGALGLGLSSNVRSAYHFLANNYEPGAEIYVFGFSRGAYTARSLCGFIGATGGLLRKPGEITVLRAYLDEYVTESRLIQEPDEWTVAGAWDQMRATFGDIVGAGLADHPRYRDVKIRFLGVYDTVGALGIPLPKATKLNEPIVGFHDTKLGGRVEHAVHALAVDERRGPFLPTLWAAPQDALELKPGQTCLQVWFPGVHSDIGGGYPERGIGDITLDFMLRRAAEAGLVLDPARIMPPEMRITDLPIQHESFDGKWRRLEKVVDDLGVIRTIAPTVGRDGQNRPLMAMGRQLLHPSVVDRLHRSVEVMEDEGNPRRITYEPKNIPWAVDAIRTGKAPLPIFRERAELRLLVSEPGELDGKPCTIRDRAAHGRRIEMDSPPAKGARVRLGGISAEVVWVKGREAGLKLAS